MRAEEGQTVKIIPTLGLPFEREVRTGMKPISELVGGILCRVQVQVVEPVSEQVAQAAPPLRQATEQLSGTTGAVLDAPRSAATATPRSRAAAPTPAAAAPTFTPQQAAAAAPAFAPAFGALPSSFLKGAAGPAPGLRAFDPDLLLGSAFPGLRAGSPAYLGYDPASAVTTASQVQALPVDALTEGGVGVPALIAVLALSGVAAFTVRRVVLGRAGCTVVVRRVAPPPRRWRTPSWTGRRDGRGGRGPRRGRRRAGRAWTRPPGPRSPRARPSPPEKSREPPGPPLRRTW